MFGDHAAYIIPAYAISAVVIIGLFVWFGLQYSARKKQLAILQDSGVHRRSGAPDAGKTQR